MIRIIVWLRNDLRVLDNYALDWAMRYGGKGTPKEILPVFSFDPRFYQANYFIILHYFYVYKQECS